MDDVSLLTGRRAVTRCRLSAALAVILAIVVGAGPLGVLPRAEGARQARAENLPYLINDGGGTQWRIFQGGWLQQQGNQPIYSQAAMLSINGNAINQTGTQGSVDEKTGELILDDLSGNGFSVTRRILFNKEGNYVRYVDVLRNTQAQDQSISVGIQTNLNYGVNTAQMVPDTKKRDHNLAWLAQTGAGQSAVEMFGGHNAKNVPAIAWQQGNNTVQATIALTVPAGREIAIMHFHSVAASQDAGLQWVTGLKESLVMRSIAPAIRRLIANFTGGGNFVGDVEILRGDLLDVVELRTGDQFKGNLQAARYDLQTPYGATSLPAEGIVGLINVGQFRPRQLLITSDGQIIGGQLKKDVVELQLSSGQLTQIPLNQVARLGYRKRSNEPEEWNFEGRPMVMMQSGERIGVVLPQTPVEVMTRYGLLRLEPRQLAGVLLQSEDNSVHEVRLTDGSKFAGLLTADQLSLQLETSRGQTVQFPTRDLSRIQFAGKAAELDETTPQLHLVNEDVLVASMSGTMKLDTAFDTLNVNAAEIRALVHLPEGSPDVQISLWDGTTVKGNVQEQSVACQLQCGATVTVALSMIREYSQPQPQPAPVMLERIKSAIKDLNSDDWKRRDRAAALLSSMGPVASGVLNALRAGEPEETQKGIDNVLKDLDRQRKAQHAGSSPAPAPAAPPGDSGAQQPPASPEAIPQFAN